jgi:hypothetical protein
VFLKKMAWRWWGAALTKPFVRPDVAQKLIGFVVLILRWVSAPQLFAIARSQRKLCAQRRRIQAITILRHQLRRLKC